MRCVWRSDKPLLPVVGILVWDEVVQRIVCGETLGMRRGEEGVVATEKRERMLHQAPTRPQRDGELHGIVGLQGMLLGQLRRRREVASTRVTSPTRSTCCTKPWAGSRASII